MPKSIVSQEHLSHANSLIWIAAAWWLSHSWMLLFMILKNHLVSVGFYGSGFLLPCWKSCCIWSCLPGEVRFGHGWGAHLFGWEGEVEMNIWRTQTWLSFRHGIYRSTHLFFIYMVMTLYLLCFAVSNIWFWKKDRAMFFFNIFACSQGFPKHFATFFFHPLKRWANKIPPASDHHQSNFSHSQDALIDIQIKRIHEYKRRSFPNSLGQCFWRRLDGRTDSLMGKPEVEGLLGKTVGEKRGSHVSEAAKCWNKSLQLCSPLWGWTWAVRWRGCGVKAADEHPLCDSSLPGRNFVRLCVRFFFF